MKKEKQNEIEKKRAMDPFYSIYIDGKSPLSGRVYCGMTFASIMLRRHAIPFKKFEGGLKDKWIQYELAGAIIDAHVLKAIDSKSVSLKNKIIEADPDLSNFDDLSDSYLKEKIKHHTHTVYEIWKYHFKNDPNLLYVDLETFNNYLNEVLEFVEGCLLIARTERKINSLSRWSFDSEECKKWQFQMLNCCKTQHI